MYTVKIFTKGTARLSGPKNVLIEPDFPCLADEIAKPRPDMNIKVAAFTVSKKSISICRGNGKRLHTL